MTPAGPDQSRRTQREVAETLARAIARYQGVDAGKAKRLSSTVLASSSEKFAALHYFGVLEAQQGRYEEADCLIGEALAIDPRSAEACLNHGNVLSALDRPAEALASFERALVIRPNYAEALNSRGAVLIDLERAEEALASLNRALESRPGYVEAINNRGNALRALKRLDEAMAEYERALGLRPDHAEALINRGSVLLELRRQEEALASYDRALAVSPDHPDALLGRGTALRDLGRYREALESYDRTLAVAPTLAEARCNRGTVMQELRHYEEAAADFQRLVEIRPDYDYAWGHLLHARLHCCDWAGLQDGMTRVTALVRQGKRAALPFEFLPVSESASDEHQCARIYAADKYPPSADPVWRGERYGHDRIRIAYVSSYFHVHAMTRLMAGVFENHDKARFETIAISSGPDSPDEMTARIRPTFDRFIDVRGKSGYETARLMRDLEVDIAVEVDGYTADARTEILSHRPAPVQVSYIGYPGTLGADYVDYILADRVVIPPEDQQFYAEKVVYLPDCYQANDSSRPRAEGAPTRAEAGLPEEGFVYCSFNNNYKIAPRAFDSWMRILRRVEDSVLWLVADNAAAAGNLRREAARGGIAPERLVFAQRVSYAQHLARQRLANLFLDTLPYNAHTTGSDALWAGLPVLTCLGTTFAGRVAASLLQATGLPELVTRSPEEYEDLAVRLAGDRRLLDELTARLARNRSTCALFDTARMTRHIEAAYEIMFQRQQRGEPPAAFPVPPSPSLPA
jgi:protein O-GlcNAc transferase